MFMARSVAPINSSPFGLAAVVSRSRHTGTHRGRLKLVQSEAAPAQALSEYADRPVQFFQDILGIELWSKQIEILEKLRTNKEAHVAACHGVGKTLFAGGVAEWHFSACGFPFYTTAPTFRQVQELLWEQAIETNRMNATRKLPGRIVKTPRPGIVVAGRPDWFGRGFATNDPEKAQGRHIDNLLVIVDEAGGVDDGIWSAIDGWMTNPGCKLLTIGNPSHRKNYFFRAHHELIGNKGIATVHIAATDSPNLDGKSRWPKLVTQEWIDDKKRKWGEASYLYRTRVEGRFPTDADEKCLPIEWIEEAFRFGEELAAEEAALPPDVRAVECAPKKAALDVSRSGADKNALGYLARQRLRIVRYWNETDPLYLMAVARYVDRWVAEQPIKPSSLAVDINAVGAGAKDRLLELRTPETWGGCQLAELDWRAKPDAITEFVGTLSELYGRLRDGMNPATERENRIGLPTLDELAAVGLTKEQLTAQLNARKCGFDEYRRFWVESKKNLRKRRGEEQMGSSPDVADMFAALMFKPKTVEVIWFSGR
jgi:hypothetical protein